MSQNPRRGNVSNGASPMQGSSKPSAREQTPMSGGQHPTSSSHSTSPSPQNTPPTSTYQQPQGMKSGAEVEAQRQQARVRNVMEEEKKPTSAFTAHVTAQKAGTPTPITGTTGNVGEAQKDYESKMKAQGAKLALTPKDTYAVVSGGKKGETTGIIAKAVENGALISATSETPGKLVASGRQQIHTSRSYDPSDLGRVTTFYGGKRTMTSLNTDNSSRNADRFMTESIVTNSQGQSTTDPVLAKKYGLTYVNPNMINETFSGFVPKDANSQLAREQREWMIKSLEREKNKLVQTVPRTDFDRKALDAKVSELDTQISNIKDGKYDNSLQPMDRYTHRQSYTFQLKDSTGQGILTRRSFGNHVAHKVAMQRYKLANASNGMVKMSARMALETLKHQDNAVSKGLATVVEGAELVSFVPMWAVNHTLKNYHKDMLSMHTGGLIARDLGRAGGLQVDRVQDLKAHLEQIGFKSSDVKDIMDSQDMQLWARIRLRDAENGKVTLNEQQTNYLRTIVNGKQVTANARLTQLTKALEAKGFDMNALRGLNLDQQMKVLNKEYSRINNILKGAGKPLLGPDVKSILKEYEEISRHMQGYAKAKMGGGYVMRIVNQFILKPLQKYGGIAGEGLATTVQVSMIAQKIVTTTVKTAWGLMRSLVKLPLRAALAATQFRIDALQKKIAKLEKKGKSTKKLTDKLNKKLGQRDKLNKLRNPLGKLRDKAMSKLRETALGKRVSSVKKTITKPFSAVADRFRRLFRKFIPKGPNPVVKAIMQVLNNIKRAIGVVLKPILAFCSGLLLVVTVIMILALTIASIINAFNFGGQEYDTQQLIVQYLRNKCYLATFDEIDDVILAHTSKNTINSRNITFVDIKDYEAYNEWMDEADDEEDYTQSSNCAEILSMALIKYNFDFGTVKDRFIIPGKSYSDRYESVQEYVRQLWNGSHSIIVTFDPDTSTSDSSVNANIIWTTIYLTGLFDCGLADSIDIQYYDVAPREYTFGNLYYYLREEGLSHEGAVAIMVGIASRTQKGALLSLESPVYTTLQTGGMFGMCAWKEPKRTEVLNFLEENGYKTESVEGQVKFLMQELANDYPTLLSQLKSTGYSLEDLTISVLSDYFHDTPSMVTPSEDPSASSSSTSSTEPSSSTGFDAELLVASSFSDLLEDYKNDPAKRAEDLKPSDNSLIAETAMKYIGHNHYTQGNSSFPGTRLTHFGGNQSLFTSGNGNGVLGTDCTGLIMYVMSELGYEHKFYSTSAYPTTLNSQAGSTTCVWVGSPSQWSSAESVIQVGDIIVATGGTEGHKMGHAMICTKDKASGTVMQCAMNDQNCKTVGNCSQDSSEKSASAYMNWVNKNYSNVTVRLFRLNG